MARKSLWIFCLCCINQAVHAQPESFRDFINVVKTEATDKGISNKTIDLLSQQSKPFKKLGDKKQPVEVISKSFGNYLKANVTEQTVFHLADFYSKYHEQISNIADFYQVQPRFILATWAVISNNGQSNSSYPALSIYASKSYKSGSPEFKGQLITALSVIDSGKINAQDLKSDYLGKMGQVSFTPKLFADYAQDWDKDGKFDVWHNNLDSLATVAFFLNQNNWDDSITWGRQVILNNTASHDSTEGHPFSYWTQKGVTKRNGAPLSKRNDIKARLIQPLKTDNRHYLVYNNFDTLTQWPNVDDNKALAITYLSEKLKPILRKK